MNTFSARLFCCCLVIGLAACSRPAEESAAEPAAAKAVAAVDAKRLLAADSEPGSWMSHGRTYDEQRFSPLAQVNAENVGDLALAWHFDIPGDQRGQESTPIVVDGVMYVTSAWSLVHALDAATGELIWSYDPQVPGATAADACCDVVNRGVAVWQGKVYLATLDGRLLALDAATGKPVWETLTVPAGSRYTSTAAPRIIKGRVLIGNAGAEMGVRGYVSAYDAESGELAWRFYTVPGDPSKPFENPVLEKAAATWTGEWWKLGGGGTVWDSMAYDPKLDLLYIGVGNGSPWNQALRSPGGGDNLFLSSMVALRPETGEYVWHYQTTPGDTWDFTATQHMILADLEIDGQKRAVIMQAPKNGFFYVLDRATGELISTQAYTPMNWATGIDPATGRPIENPEARYGTTGKPWFGMPGPGGGHNWQPMSFSPLTGLVYIPVIEMTFPYFPDLDFQVKKLAWNIGVDLNAGSLPQDPAVKAQIKSSLKGHLAAWDPVAQREVWRVQHDEPWSGGLLSTAGNLVFQGSAMGQFIAYRADSGERLWSAETQAGVLAPPISYEVDGVQYVALEVGWGGIVGLAPGELTRDRHTPYNLPRVLAFRLGGKDALPAPPPLERVAATPPADEASAEVIERGKAHYHRYCGACHGDTGVGTRVLPDLRASGALGSPGTWRKMVYDGVLEEHGMIGYGAELSPEDIEEVRAYIVRRAHEQPPEPPEPVAAPGD